MLFRRAQPHHARWLEAIRLTLGEFEQLCDDARLIGSRRQAHRREELLDGHGVTRHGHCGSGQRE
jgi:hypothetical protein